MGESIMTKYNFGPAFENERIVWGAHRPGYGDEPPVEMNRIKEWITFMKDDGIRSICCLLTKDEKREYYGNEVLSNLYFYEFGQNHVFSMPVEDRHLCNASLLKERILPLLDKSYVNGEKLVIHCSGGSGRTGHVLAAWLVYKYGLSVEKALAAVKLPFVSRNPYEAIYAGNATTDDLHKLLMQCQKCHTG
jgi:protein-tyrosine phosphatase